MNNIDWNRAPNWAGRHGYAGLGMAACWIGDEKYAYVDGQQGGRIFAFEEGFREEEFLNVTKRPAAWNGEGLPPVGTVCTVESNSPHSHWGAHCGKQVAIIAHSVSETQSHVAVYKVLIDGNYEYHALVEDLFRPIKTPEQIAAEKRVEAAQEWLKGIEQEYGEEIADKCESILFEAERKNTAQ